MNKCVFTKGRIADWESEYIHVMPYQFVCYENFDGDEVWEWCLANLGGNMNWMVTINGVLLRKEEDAVHFALAWC